MTALKLTLNAEGSRPDLKHKVETDQSAADAFKARYGDPR